MEIYLNSNFGIETINDDLTEKLIKGSSDFDLLKIYIPTTLKNSFTTIYPLYSVKRADGRELGPYATITNADTSVTDYYGWTGYFNSRDLSVEGALEITLTFFINDSIKKTVAKVTTNVAQAVEVVADIYMLNDSQIYQSLLASINHLASYAYSFANEVVQSYSDLAGITTTNEQYRVVVLNDSNHDNNPSMYQWNGSSWDFKGYFDWTQYLDNKFDTYTATINQRMNNQDATIAGLGQLHPSGVDTSANILAKASDDGIWIGSDTDDWYYWDANSSQYVSGGPYQATAVAYKSLNFDKTNFVDYIHNYYDYENMTTYGKTFSLENGVMTETVNSNFNYMIVPIEAGHKYIISGTDYRGWITNNDYSTIYGWFGDYSNTLTDVLVDNTTSGGTKLVINIKKANFNVTTYMVLNSDTMSSNYISYSDDYYKFTKSKNEPYNLIESTNIFDKDTMVGGEGKLLDRTNNVMTEYNNSAFYYVKIPITEIGDYTISYKSYYVWALDSESNYVARYGTSGGETPYTISVTNPIVRYLVVNVRYTDCDINSFQMNKGSNILPYEKYYDSYYSLENVKREYYVSAKKYLKFTDVIKYLANDTSEKTIYIESGNYDIFSEFGGSAYAATITSNMTMEQANPVIPPNTKVIGIGYVELDFTPSAADIGQVAALILSPINIQGSVELENLTIVGDNCRYCIHDESGGYTQFTGSIKKYKNIHCIKTQSNGYGHAQAYASGFDKDFSFEFDNCVFDGVLAFSMHNRGQGTNNIVIKNSVFKSTGANPSIRLGTVWSQHNLVSINNCYMNNDVKIISETSQVNNGAYDVTLVNCTGSYTCTTDTYITNTYGFKDYK